jgi:hypothetical protein
VFLGENLVSWFLKRQNIVSRLSAKADYRAVVNDVAEACWLRQLHNPLSQNIVSRLSAKADYRAVVNDVAEACWLRQLHNPLSRVTLV